VDAPSFTAISLCRFVLAEFKFLPRGRVLAGSAGVFESSSVVQAARNLGIWPETSSAPKWAVVRSA
jgi:hypothetical protein